MSSTDRPPSKEINETKEEKLSPLTQQGFEHIRNYPRQELYRIVVDGYQHADQNGWVGYEGREKGCLKAVFNGLKLAMSNLDEPVTFELICGLHKACSSNVKDIVDRLGPGVIREKILYGSNKKPIRQYVGLTNEYTTDDGMRELSLWLKEQADSNDWGKDQKPAIAYGTNLLYFHPEEKTGLINSEDIMDVIWKGDDTVYYIIPVNGPEIRKRLTDLIVEYNGNITNCSDSNSKIHAMVNFIWELEHLHAFEDCNTRTHVILLLNRLLVQNGMPPATYEDPNIFFTQSRQELFNEVCGAIRMTTQIIEGKKKAPFDFDSANIPKKYQNTYLDIVSDFVIFTQGKEKLQAECITKLDEFIKSKESKGNTLYGVSREGLFGRTVGISTAIQISAAQELKKLLNKESTTLSEKHRAIINDSHSDLGKIVKYYQKLEVLPSVMPFEPTAKKTRKFW